MRPFNVLSLFDGISCGRVALERAGIPIGRYVAYEIDKYALEVSKSNYPDIEQRGDVTGVDFTEFRGFDILIGGSPCTHWSIAKAGSGKRETTLSGLGGALFMRYVDALRQSDCRWFLYENNASISKEIKEGISALLGVQPIEINSALVSAQKRKRCYWTNIPGVVQPKDRGITLKDILHCGIVDKEKSYCLKHQAGNARDYFKKHHTQIAYQPINIALHAEAAEPVIFSNPHGFNRGGAKYDKAPCLTSNGRWENNNHLVEPLRIGAIEHGGDYDKGESQQYRVYSPDGKSVAQCANGGGIGAKTGLYACQIRIGTINEDGKYYQGSAVYSAAGKSTTMCSHSGGGKSNTGLYACPLNFVFEYSSPLPPFVVERIHNVIRKYGYLPEMFNAYNAAEITDKATTQSTQGSLTRANSVIIIEKLQDELREICKKKIYVVKDGFIMVNGEQYPIKLADGLYIIRKLTCIECERLQTLPDNYTAVVSDTQRYKCIGNGWTIDVIAFIFEFLFSYYEKGDNL